MAINTIGESTCPVCWENKRIASKIIAVRYKVQEAIYTCENKNCIYFVTDEIGNLRIFDKSGRTPLSDSKATAFDDLGCQNAANVISKAVPSPSVSADCSSSSFLDHIFRTTEKDSAVESIMNELKTDLQNFMKNS